MIEFAMRDPRARTHALDLAGVNHRASAEAVFVLQGTLQDVREDFHVAVGVRAESSARLHTVLVYHAQRAEPHMPGVVVVGKRKRMIALQPAVPGMATLSRQ